MRGFRGIAAAVGFFLIASLAAVFILLVIPYTASQAPQISHGPNWERSCTGGTCTLTIYQHQKYYQDAGQWKEIEERFHDCAEGLCTGDNLYKASVSGGEVTLSRGQDSISFKLLEIKSGKTTLTPSLSTHSNSQNQLSYTYPVQGMDIKYTYLPTKFKEELTIKTPIFSSLAEDPILTYSLSQAGGSFYLEQPWACDSMDDCIDLKTSAGKGTYSITLPVEWLNNLSRAYPITIDPSVILNDSNITDDGYIQQEVGCDGGVLSRSTSADITVGHRRTTTGGTPPIISDRCRRGFVFWDISSLPENARIVEVQAYLRTEVLGNDSNNFHMFYPFEQNSSDYPDTTEGNDEFWNDAGDGSSFTDGWYEASGGGNIITFIPSAAADIDYKLHSGSPWWGFSIVSPENNSANFWSIHHTYKSKEDSTSSQRPQLNITYLYFANESEGRQAIEQGISGSLPSPEIQTDKQIYLLNENGQQFLGTFDKTTQKDNQSWAFNYVTEGESFTNIPSLFTTLNTWENQSLIFQEIATQVETLINQTKE